MIFFRLPIYCFGFRGPDFVEHDLRLDTQWEIFQYYLRQLLGTIEELLVTLVSGNTLKLLRLRKFSQVFVISNN